MMFLPVAHEQADALQRGDSISTRINKEWVSVRWSKDGYLIYRDGTGLTHHCHVLHAIREVDRVMFVATSDGQSPEDCKLQILETLGGR